MSNGFDDEPRGGGLISFTAWAIVIVGLLTLIVLIANYQYKEARELDFVGCQFNFGHMYKTNEVNVNVCIAICDELGGQRQLDNSHFNCNLPELRRGD